VSRGKIKALVAFAFILVAAFYFWRDFNLTNGSLGSKLPDIIVENLDFRRTIEGRDWHLQAATAEHDSGLIIARNLVVNVTEPASGRSTIIRAVSGELLQDSYYLQMRSLDGAFSLGDRSMDMSAPTANYERSSDLWSFDEGVEFWDDDAYIKGGSATITADGTLSLKKGAYVRWSVD
jgi:hypothetical protein